MYGHISYHLNINIPNNIITDIITFFPGVPIFFCLSGFLIWQSIEGKTLKEVSTFVSDKLSTLDSVLSTSTHFILKKYKDHGSILSKKYEDEREQITP